MIFQAVAKSTNSGSLVIGEISAQEAEISSTISHIIDGKGYYLISIDNKSETGLGEVLAKFVSEDAAHELAKFFRISGRLEKT